MPGFVGLNVGPVVVGKVSSPRSPSPRKGGGFTTWVLIVLVIIHVAPAAGVMLVLGTAVVLAGRASQHSDERKHDDHSTD